MWRLVGLFSLGEPMSIRARCSLVWLQFPENVNDFPVAVELGDFEIIDPIGRDDLHDSGIVVAIKNRHFFQLSVRWRLFSAAVACALNERHRAHVIELAAPGLGISRYHSLRQFGMKRAFHPCGVASVPTFDVIQRGFLDRFVFIGRDLLREKEAIQKERCRD